MRIGIFGGTFNPPHMGHVGAAKAAAGQLSLDLLYIIPTNIPPHKALPEGSATPLQRLEMARIIASLIPNARASGIEIEHGGASYTFETVREIASRHENAELWLIIGTDMLLTFESWREPREILRYARLAAVCRSERDRGLILNTARELTQSFGARIDIIENIPLEVSSTELRLGDKFDALPREIAQYIECEGLYGERELKMLREKAQKALAPHRYAHTLGCEQMAAGLARIHGENVLDARRAALLHDITKELSVAEQLQLCRRFDIILDYHPETMEMLIHADTGGEVARRELDMPQHICDAIKYHSTGRKNMTKLEKIIYVADKIEPNRMFADVPPIRETAKTDLDAAVLEVLRQSILSLDRRGIKPHTRTLEALEYMKNRVKPD